MATQLLYECNSCGAKTASWFGKCPTCNEWNTIQPVTVGGQFDKKNSAVPGQEVSFTSLDKVKAISEFRVESGLHELDRVLGGGFVHGEVILLTGEPGVGKSTLILKAVQNLKVMYIAGEESASQIKQRAERINHSLKSISVTNEINIDNVLYTLSKKLDDFDVCVIDSIQTVYSPEVQSIAGSVTQIKVVTQKIIEFAKNNNKIALIVGHVTKGGELAGPKTLEHMVDCVLYLEGEKYSYFRLLRAGKNRFGPVDEVGVFTMQETGLQEVVDSSAMLDNTPTHAPGRAIVASLEGSRVLFYEIQSLVVPTSLPMPRRLSAGVDLNRTQLLLAVIRKYLRTPLDTYDIYVSVAGGLSVKSPSADLGIIASVLSSLKNISLPKNAVFSGEIGLLGEVRPSQGEKKIMASAKRFGFSKVYTNTELTKVAEIAKVFSHVSSSTK